MRFPPLFLCFVVSAPDGFIRRYRLRPLSEIGKWEGETKQRCENVVTARRYFAPCFFWMVAQTVRHALYRVGRCCRTRIR
jgi:hypothetical protein